MSLPPQVLRIKRKRVDDPVDSLYIEEDARATNSKRRVTEQDFVFRRLVTDGQDEVQFKSVPGSKRPMPVKSNGIPIVVPTVSSPQRHLSKQSELKVIDSEKKSTPEVESNMESTVSNPRRFILSRSSAALAASQSVEAGNNRKRRRDTVTNIAVFEETKLKIMLESESTRPDRSTEGIWGDESGKSAAQLLKASPRKRPGATSAISKSASSASLRRVEHEDARADETRRALQAFARDELVDNERQESSKKSIPKEHDIDAMETDGSDNEYTYDTYVRQAYTDAALLPPLNNPAKQQIHNDNETFGYVVMPPRPSAARGSAEDGDATFWNTFGDLVDDDDSSEEADWDTEQDDENAENFYGADYPEDELDSDDERGDQAIGYARFRSAHGGTSDNETFSDVEDYDALDVHDSWIPTKEKYRGRVWRLGGHSHGYDSEHEDDHQLQHDNVDADDEGDDDDNDDDNEDDKML